MIMPSNGLNYLSREDVGSIIAYLKTVPPVHKVVPPPDFSPVGKVLLGAGAFGNVITAELIDHTYNFPGMPEIGANVAYGAYFTELCKECHGPDFAGGSSPDPGSPP
jgi:mono/diheme cytochrome c family protein